jgi:ornithine cyclodeaminase/alanine dehydrogenase-like protein (mu-crystallin family)
MALLLNEGEVRSLLTMPVALDAVEDVFRRLAAGEAVLHVRRRLQLPENAFLHYMAGADIVSGYMGMKIYTSVRGALRFLVPLYRAKTGQLLALIEADYLGQMRTGAASGVATKFMARADAKSIGIIGTGLQARTQLEAICAVRAIEQIRAFGRNPEKRAEFAREMTAKLGVAVTPAASAEDAIRDADIVVAATTSSRPVIQGAWLAPGTHINAVGANFPRKRELDDETIRRAAVIAADSIEESKDEAGDLIETVGRESNGWSRVHELADIVAGKQRGRTSPAEITLFKSNGIAVEDVAVAARIYELAEERQVGLRIPLWEHCG